MSDHVLSFRFVDDGVETDGDDLSTIPYDDLACERMAVCTCGWKSIALKSVKALRAVAYVHRMANREACRE